jgi:amidase
MGETETWKLAGEYKRKALLSLIPFEWRLTDPLPSRAELPDLRNGTIQSYVSNRETIITEMDCLSLLEQLASGAISSREVTMAFCHRAAVAHQMVSHMDSGYLASSKYLFIDILSTRDILRCCSERRRCL